MTTRIENVAPPKATARLLVAMSIGLVSGAAAWAVNRLEGFRHQDFSNWYLAARALVAGEDPFTSTAQFWEVGLVYPLPAVLLTIPLTPFPVDVAAGVFVGVTSALCAFVLTRRAWWPLIAFGSGAFVHAVMVAQWSMLLLAAAVSGWSWMIAIKPNMGLAIAVQHLRWRPVLAGLALLAVSVLVRPDWPLRWIANSRASYGHYALWQTGIGVVALLAWTRWRRPEARLLGTLAIVPISPLTYDLLPLFAIPQSRRQALLLATSTGVAFALTGTLAGTMPRDSYLRVAGWAAILLGYVPALAMILGRPNDGIVPAAVERLASRLASLRRREA